MDLPIIYGDDQWMLHEEQGHARVTKTKEAFEAAAAPTWRKSTRTTAVKDAKNGLKTANLSLRMLLSAANR